MAWSSVFVRFRPFWSTRARLATLLFATTTTARALANEPLPSQLGFKDAVAKAIAHNPSAELARAEVTRAEALVEQARAAWYPQLTANATYTRLDNERSFQGSRIQPANALNANLTAVVPLLAPQSWVGQERSRDNLDIFRATSADTRRTVAMAAGRAYLEIIAQQRLLENSKNALDTARATEEFARQRLQGGVGQRLDFLRASQVRAAAEASVVDQTIALERAREALGILVGQRGPVDVGGPADLDTPKSLDDALVSSGQRSDVIAQRDRLDTARRSATNSYAAYLPNVNMLGVAFFQGPEALAYPRFGWQAQLAFSWAVYDGGRRYGVVHELDALRDEAQTTFDATNRQASSDVRTAFHAVQAATASLDKTREAGKLAEEALQLALQAYRAGTTANLDVIDAERRQREAQTAVAVAENAASIAKLDLLAASGHFP